MDRIQSELVEWQKHNFPNREVWHPLLGIGEEAGELYHAFLKRAQGIRGTKAEHDAAIKDVLADLYIFMADFANAEGIDLQKTIEQVWDGVVSRRDWSKLTAPTEGA